MRGNTTITVKPKAKVDRLRGGSATAGDPYPVEGCLVWPLASHEEGKGWVGIDGKGVKAPAGSKIPASAIVVIDGEEFEVQGFPQDFGRKGVLFTARRIAVT